MQSGNESLFRSGPSWAERWGAIVGGDALSPLGSSSSSRSRTLRNQGRSMSQVIQRPVAMARSVQEDLEDYLNRIDGYSRIQNASVHNELDGPPLEIPTVERFGLEDMAKLRRARYGQSGTRSSSSSSSTKLSKTADVGECHICLAAFRSGETLLELPCDAKHRFHEKCIRQWLSKSVSCPLCRVDVKALLPPSGGSSSAARHALAPKRSQRTPVSRGLARSSQSLPHAHTALGGFVTVHERNPPQSWERPSYIPAHLRHLAQYLEVNYPGRGVARIWRVPNITTGDLSHALPVEIISNLGLQ